MEEGDGRSGGGESQIGVVMLMNDASGSASSSGAAAGWCQLNLTLGRAAGWWSRWRAADPAAIMMGWLMMVEWSGEVDGRVSQFQAKLKLVKKKIFVS